MKKGKLTAGRSKEAIRLNVNDLGKSYSSLEIDKILVKIDFQKKKIILTQNLTPEDIKEFQCQNNEKEIVFLDFERDEDSLILFLNPKLLNQFSRGDFKLVTANSSEGYVHLLDFSQFPRKIRQKIKSGIVVIKKRFPHDFTQYISQLSKKQEFPIASTKIHGLIKEKPIYDILITFREDAVKEIDNLTPDKRFIPRFDTHKNRIYLSMKAFPEFLRTQENTHFTCFPRSHSEKDLKPLSFQLKKDYYDQFIFEFLREKGTEYNESDILNKIQELKSAPEKAKIKGSDPYFSYIKDFLKNIRKTSLESVQEQNKKQYFKAIKQEIKDSNLDNYDFKKPQKRNYYNANAVIYVMKNHDLLLSLDSTLELDYESNLIEKEIDILFKRALYGFQMDYEEKLKRRSFNFLSEAEIDQMKEVIKKIKLSLQRNITHELIEEAIHYACMFKTNFSAITKNLNLKEEPLLYLVVGIYDAFARLYYSKMTLRQAEDISKTFLDIFSETIDLPKKKILKFIRYSQDPILLLYLTTIQSEKTALNFQDRFVDSVALSDMEEILREDFGNLFDEQKNFEDIISRLYRTYFTEEELERSVKVISDSLNTLSPQVNKLKIKLVSNKIKDLLFDRFESLKNLFFIKDLASEYIKLTFRSARATPSVLAAGGFGALMLGLGLGDKVTPYIICLFNNIDPTSIHRQLKKMVYGAQEPKTEFKDLKIRNEAFISDLRESLLTYLIKVPLATLRRKNLSNKQKTRLMNNIVERWKFFGQYQEFRPHLEKISEQIKELKKEIKESLL